MAHFLGIDLRPTDWVQGVEHHGDTGVEGRRFIANCKVRALSELELSNGLRLEDLRAQMQIFIRAIGAVVRIRVFVFVLFAASGLNTNMGE